MLYNNINPDLLKIGPLSIRFYGLVYALGFILVAYLLSRKAGKIKNLTRDNSVDLVTIGMVSALVGARIFHVLSEFSLYQNNPIGIFEIWKGGLGFQGGLLGGIIASFLYCRKHKINLLEVLDTAAIPLPLIVGFGRIANYINSEHVGLPSNLPWCVVFEKVDSICRHPSQIYESISMFALFIILYMLHKKLGKKAGMMTGAFIIGYGIMRFITDLFREYTIDIFGLSHTQVYSIMMIMAGSFFIFKLSKVKK